MGTIIGGVMGIVAWYIPSNVLGNSCYYCRDDFGAGVVATIPTTTAVTVGYNQWRNFYVSGWA